MLLGKETSVLGYPDEVSRALDADHHNVCKYDGVKDPNYVIVRSALRDIMRRIIQRPAKKVSSNRANLETLQTQLALGELPSVDLLFYRGQWKAGTCNWILEDESYQDWSQADKPVSRFLWLTGGAGVGKSVLSSFIVNALEERGSNYQYFFIRHSQPRKRTLSFLLRSIAYQFAKSSPEFLQRVAMLEAEQIDFETVDAKAIWERLFRSIYFQVVHDQPSHWVVDGLDEADNPRGFIEFLSEISSSCPSIRVLVVSRSTPELVATFEPVSPTSISINGHLDDIRLFIRRAFLFTGSSDVKEKIIKQLEERAGNNFLVSTISSLPSLWYFGRQDGFLTVNSLQIWR
jgi:hypothetical protein